ncbi:MAG: hypothetical protein OXK78_14245 [Caldilineaceae bacterium]|nr:hypothetical protein [Caldilineaceae bacterium]
MTSRIFSTQASSTIERDTLALLNSESDILSPYTLGSTRAAGDAIQDILAEKFDSVLGIWVSEYSTDFARRAMADLAFKDVDGYYYIIDVKSHRVSTNFNMPNLTSVERLARFYEDDMNYFVLLLVQYDLQGEQAVFSRVHFVPIEFLSWDCLTVGALGWGQIQITNSNNIIVDQQPSRKLWMLQLCEVMLEFYPKEIEKIGDRLRRFEEIKAYWLDKKEY